MTAVYVVDSSVVVALLIDGGPAGDWIANLVEDAALAAPELVMFEAANILRRQLLNGRLELAEATLAYQDLLALPLQLWPFAPLADRTWQLRDAVTAHDASYIALAELLGTSLVTLDARLAGSNGPTCAIVTPATT